MTRRRVQVSQSFFNRLDELLPAERTADGGPSATDFLLHEVPTVVDLLAEDYVGTTLPVEDAPPVRVLITNGVLAPFIAVYADLRVDDVVEVIYLDVEQT